LPYKRKTNYMEDTQKQMIIQIIRNLGFANEYEFAKIRMTAWLKEQLKESFYAQEIQFKQILNELMPEIKFPFGSSRQTALDERQRQQILWALEQFGYSLYEYVNEQLFIYYHEKAAHYHTLIKFYQKKYQTTEYEVFAQKFHSYPFETMEKEDDDREWEDAIRSLSWYQSKIYVNHNDQKRN
jgi:hypothetical protein